MSAENPLEYEEKSMILSMTGFGRGTAVRNGREITVELRSVNSRYFEYSSRMPRTCSYLDSRLKKQLNERVTRGKVELSMTIQNVEASFVAVQVGGGVNISARSLGAVNVQVIMESLGGGGHQTMAAAQLKHITPEAARARIQTAIDQYRESQKKPLSKNEPESRKKEKQG